MWDDPSAFRICLLVCSQSAFFLLFKDGKRRDKMKSRLVVGECFDASCPGFGFASRVCLKSNFPYKAVLITPLALRLSIPSREKR